MQDIVCINSPEGNANSVAEHATGLLLALFHNIVNGALQTANEKWLVEQNRVHELEGKTIGIIGYGNTGRAFAKKLEPFSMHVLAYDKYLERYTDRFATESAMSEIFSQADIVSFHVPLTDETRHMVNRDYLQWVSKPVHLINTSRGKIIDHNDLLDSILSTRVIDAALDVYENENFALHTEEERNIFRSLIKTGRVIFTPHVAGKSYESQRKIAEVLVRKIASYDFVKSLSKQNDTQTDA